MRGILNVGPAIEPLRQMYMTELLDVRLCLSTLVAYHTLIINNDADQDSDDVLPRSPAGC